MQDGRWRAAVTTGRDADGRLKRKVFTAATRREVADELKKALRDQQRGININPGKQTVGAFLAAWLENTVEPSVRRPKTYRSYEQMVRNHLAKTVPENEWRGRNWIRFRG